MYGLQVHLRVHTSPVSTNPGSVKPVGLLECFPLYVLSLPSTILDAVPRRSKRGLVHLTKRVLYLRHMLMMNLQRICGASILNVVRELPTACVTTQRPLQGVCV